MENIVVTNNELLEEIRKVNSDLKNLISASEKLKNLKGTSINIAQDLTREQQEEHKILRKHLLLARQDINNTCFIKNHKLYINEDSYTAADLQQESNTELENRTISSDPGTPILRQEKSRITKKTNLITEEDKTEEEQVQGLQTEQKLKEGNIKINPNSVFNSNTAVGKERNHSVAENKANTPNKKLFYKTRHN
ncbi:unnamed protein product [Diabrotica balteata]|uniref:Uncharacterized protein n=1 Tax=Diabrotica balteata TaxID=107213 RepID=A0A9N9XB60_DIABA|nr:unnamed protein product [Diabrotica balteata]